MSGRPEPPGRRLRLVAFDLDGVIWRGSELLPGVHAALEDVLRRGLELRYVSNNSTAHRRTVSERLSRWGLPASVEKVLTSGFVTGRWLGARLPAGAPVMVVGEAGLMEELREAGLDPYHASEKHAAARPAAVVVGMDRGIDFRVLAAAQAAIRAGSMFVATNRDATFPTPDGEVPGAGAVVAAVATAAEAEPVLMGKPGAGLAEVLATASGVPPEETMFVGDRVSTDVVMGKAVGMCTVLVLTGVTTREELAQMRAAARRENGRGDGVILPDYALNDLTELPALLHSLDTESA